MKKNSLKFKMLAMLLAALLGMSLWSGAAVAAGTNKVVVTGMNFRKTPAGVKIGAIPAGTTVVYNYSYGEWDNVTYNGKTGWIHYGNLKDVSTPAPAPVSGDEMSVVVTDGYLALRNAKAYSSSNEIGKLYTGETVSVQDKSDSTYWYVYSSKLNKSGYVNSNYLVYTNLSGAPTRTVKVQDGYLALRTGKAFDSANEIGKLYTGETVQVTDQRHSQYWYVYAPSLGKYGFVNKDYLVSGGGGSSTGTTMTVKVQSGYLALRNAKAFDSSNEIGKLYTGETVQVQDTSTGQYWYVYAPSLGKSGYVNKDYLVGSVTTKTVKVQSGYLALRNAKAFDSSNEIGKLYTGETVQVQDTSDSQYWYVYAPSLGKSGYVNKDYLV